MGKGGGGRWWTGGEWVVRWCSWLGGGGEERQRGGDIRKGKGKKRENKKNKSALKINK